MAMKWAFYNLLFAVGYPFLLPGFLVRMIRRGGYAARLGDRFALYPESVRAAFAREGSFVWVHAVSVGEVQVAGQLMREWRKVEPDVRFCFSTTSSTGWRTAQGEVSERDVLIYNPIDFPNFVKSALKTIRPRAIILTESEIWPNFVLTARRMGIPVFLVNARVSDRSAPRYKAARFLLGDVFASLARVFAQSDLDAARLVDAGVPRERIDVTGSFKFDVARRNEAKERELRAWVGPGRILLGGSTWPGEDKILLGIYASLRERVKSASPTHLVLAPRHFEKADAVEANIRAAGFDCVRRSRGDSPAAATSPAVYLADTTGELMGLYGIADVVFVGKTICAHGGQNMIEPCLCGKPTAVGPNTENFRSVMSDLLAADAIVQVKDAAALEDFVVRSFTDDGGLGARATEAVSRRRGVVPKCVAAIRGALSCLALALVLCGCGKKEPLHSSDPEERPFRPVKIAAAAIATLEKPMAVKTLLADERAEMFRPFFEGLGHVCVSNAASSSSAHYDIVFLAGRHGADELRAAASHVGESGVFAWRLNVKGMSAADFKSCVEGFPFADAHFWMPGMEEWMFVGRRERRQVKMSAMLDVFSREEFFALLAEARLTAFSDVFASYVGPLSAARGAFCADDLSVPVRPEFFVTKDIPPLDWIVPGDVDDDIFRSTLAEMESVQDARRLVVLGDVQAAEGKGDEATETWARALKRNPRDTMLCERIDRLKKNAETLLRIGNVAAAAKCFETMVVINPLDASAVFDYGMCLRRLGKKELSNQVLKRAKELRE